MPIISTETNLWSPYDGYISPYPGGAGFEEDFIEQNTDIKVKDSASGLSIPVGGVVGWDGDYIQASAIANLPLNFAEVTGFLLAGAECEPLSARRLSTLVICPMFDTSGATATIHPVYEDINGVRVLGPEISIAATTITDDLGNYYGTMETVPTNGASLAGVLIATISAGLLALMISCT